MDCVRSAPKRVLHWTRNARTRRGIRVIFSVNLKDMKLKDQIAVITGGSMGIGEAIARLFVAEGAKVVLCSRDVVRCEEARQRIGHLEQTGSFACDVRERKSIDAMIARVLSHFGCIDIWINNAGYGLLDSTEKLDLNAARA